MPKPQDLRGVSEGNVLSDGAYGVFEGALADQVVMAEYRNLGTWAADMVALTIERLFGDGPGTFIDVGANIGLVSIPIVERTGSLGIAFEPEPRNFEYLTRNVARHGLSSRIECHRAACYSHATSLPLALSATNLGDHRLQQPNVVDPERSIVEVPAVAIDDVLRGRDLPHPIVIKVDAQGSEVCVFEGARETLARADYVVTEYWPEGMVAHGDSPERFAALMCELPFGAVLHVLPLPEPLNSSEHVFLQMRGWYAGAYEDPGFFDLLFSRHWVLPKSSPAMDELKALLAADARGT